MGTLTGKKVFITGAEQGIGRATIDKTTTFCTFRQERRYLRYLLIRLNTVHHHKTKVVAKSSVLLI